MIRSKCPAHGDEGCADCGRISAEYLIEGPACRSCDYFGETGVHWDTCAGRIRGPITTPGLSDVPADVDMVAHPPHYTSSPAKCSGCGKGIECIDVTRHLSFNIGNVLKYCWRLGLKGDPVEQLRKAAFYLANEIERLEAQS